MLYYLYTTGLPQEQLIIARILMKHNGPKEDLQMAETLTQESNLDSVAADHEKLV